MSLKKSIEHGKEHRQEYRGSKRWDHSCRNHGTCSVCKGDRTYKNVKREIEDLLDEAEDLRSETSGFQSGTQELRPLT